MNSKALFFPLGAAFLALSLVACSSPPEQKIPEGSPVRASESADAAKIVKETIAFARKGKTDAALENVGVEQISRYLLGAEYDKVTPAQQEKFRGLIRDFVALRGLPQAMKLLGDNDSESIQFGAARKSGNRVLLPSSLPGTDLAVTWILQKAGRDLVITDFLDPRGRSSMQRSRDKQIMPLYRKRGMDGLNSALEKALSRMR